jgi:AcrR family transcriptional regulator
LSKRRAAAKQNDRYDMPAKKPGSTRRRLLDAAEATFYHSGVHATGVDALVREAGVAKVSLYAHFGAKDGLVAAWLDERDRTWRTWLESRVYALARTPERRLLAVFDALGEWFSSDDFRGCAFVNCSAEYPELAHPVRLAARAHKAAVRGFIRRLIADAELPRAERLSSELMLLVEGAINCAVVEDDRTAARSARAVAARLIAAS